MTDKDQSNNPLEMDELASKVLEKSKDMAKKLPVLGHVIWLASQSQQFKHYFIQDIESRFLSPIVLEQCKLYLQTKAGGLPMGFASWAFLSEQAEQRYIATQRIAPGDWKSGEQLWLIDVVTPFGGANSIYKELYYEIHKNQDIHVLLPGPDQAFRKTTISELLAMRDKKEQENTTQH